MARSRPRDALTLLSVLDLAPLLCSVPRAIDAARRAFIRRRNKAWSRSPFQRASAYNLDHPVFARSRDPHDVEAHCRFVEKPRGTDR